MGYGLVKPRVVRSCVVYVRKTSNFGPCIRNLTGQSIRGASSKKKILWEKEYTFELFRVCVRVARECR